MRSQTRPRSGTSMWVSEEVTYLIRIWPHKITDQTMIRDVYRSLKKWLTSSGSDHMRSQTRPWSGTSMGLSISRTCSKSIRSGDSPPCMQNIVPSIKAAENTTTTLCFMGYAGKRLGAKFTKLSKLRHYLSQMFLVVIISIYFCSLNSGYWSQTRLYQVYRQGVNFWKNLVPTLVSFWTQRTQYPGVWCRAIAFCKH